MDERMIWTAASRHHRAMAQAAMEARFLYQAALHERAADLLDAEIRASLLAPSAARMHPSSRLRPPWIPNRGVSAAA